MRIALAAAAVMVTMLGAAEARTWRVAPGPEAQTELQRALNGIEPGDTLRLDRGRYELTRGLTLAISGVTVRGDGADRTVLSFAGQQDDAPGLAVRANRVELRDFAVEDTRGDAIAVRDCDGITLQAVRAEWTRPPAGAAYGLHAINCANVLIEDSIARGASAAGIAASSSRAIVFQRNLAERNVAGLAIENGAGADLSENTAHGNASGIAVLNLPGQPQSDGSGVRIFKNTISGNNGANFAAGDSVGAAFPSGVGVFVMAGRNVHVFDNDIGENGAANVMAAAYGGASQDAAYNPLPQDVMIRDNRFVSAADAPAGAFAALAQLGVTAMPDVLWDGADTYSSPSGPRNEVVRIVMRDNRSSRGGVGTFLSLGLNVPGAPLSEAAPNPAYPPLLEIAEPERVRIED